MNKLIKITIEFEDKIQTLEGKQAQKWLDKINFYTPITFSFFGKPFKWKIERKLNLPGYLPD